MKFETKAIHVGQEPDPTTGAIIVPIYQTSTYVQASPGKHKGYEYSRTDNPTRQALEECLASLEEARYGLALASGMAAIATVLTLLKAGDRVIASDDLYGGTYRVFERVYRDYGLEFTYVDASSPTAIERAITPQTKMIWIETPTNPLLKIVDINAVARIAKKSKAILVVDNTFSTPYFQKPLGLGADIVVHSTTKYLGGHSDTVGGAAVTSNRRFYERLKFSQNAVGAIPGPLDCFLVLRGLKTLAVRMNQHEKNTQKIASFLWKHPKVRKLIYPGLPGHPQHRLAKKQMSGFGAVLSFLLKSDLSGSKSFLRKLKLFGLAESLGGVESLAEHPAIMTHASLPKSVRQSLGITDNFVRLSVGIENVDDLIEDLKAGFAAV
jgi:cystathionine gamma-lyase